MMALLPLRLFQRHLSGQHGAQLCIGNAQQLLNLLLECRVRNRTS